MVNEIPFSVQTDESTPLLSKADNVNFALRIGDNIVCFLIGVPVGILSALSVLSRSEHITLGDLKTPGEFTDLWRNASNNEVSAASLALVAGGGVTIFIAKRHFATAIGQVKNLIFGLLRRLSCCSRGDVPGSDKAKVADLLLLIWSMSTALIFGAIGSEALSFLGVGGEISGFALKFLLASTTRYMGAKVALRQRFDLNWQLKQKALTLLSAASESELKKLGVSFAVPDANFTNVNKAIVLYLSNNELHALLKNHHIRKCFLNAGSLILGGVVFVITIVPTVVSFIPKAIQGLEIMTRQDIGHSAHYQNPLTFVLGLIFSLLSDIFYELNAVSLPFQLVLTVFLIKDAFGMGEYSQIFTYVFLTLINLAMSYGNSIGVGFVGSSLVIDGYLSYLGDTFSHLMPIGLTISTFFMVACNLQKLINGRVYNKPLPSKNGMFSINSVNESNIRGLLNHPDTDIRELNGNDFFSI